MPITRIASALALLTFACLSFAQESPQIRDLLRKERVAEAEKLARAQLAKDSSNEQAVVDFSIVSLNMDNDAALTEAATLAEACTERSPQAAGCHLALGRAYGMMAMRGGMLKAMGMIGKIKGAIDKAVELAPNNFHARDDLVNFYLMAPAVAGGGKGKAREQAEAFSKLEPKLAPLIWANVHASDKSFSKAEAALESAMSLKDGEYGDTLKGRMVSLAFRMIGENDFAGARRIATRAASLFPDYAYSHFALGRAALEQKEYDTAIASLEKAAAINPKTGAHYRLGLAYEAKGDKAKAIATLQQFVDLAPKNAAKALDDAKKRIASLKAA